MGIFLSFLKILYVAIFTKMAEKTSNVKVIILLYNYCVPSLNEKYLFVK